MSKAEAETIQKILAGNRDAYRVLMDSHFCAVHRIAFRITGNQADAEEAAQEAFLRAYNKLPGFRQDASFSTWITRIAMNTAINLVERRNRDLSQHGLRIADNPSPTEQTVQLADAHAGPERQLLDREAASLRSEALANLTLDQFAEVACDELAKIFSLTPAEIRSKLIHCHTHNWQHDGLTVGAYSYIPAANTLYFAGEHTDTTGHWGTVHAAIRSGQRAAQQILHP